MARTTRVQYEGAIYHAFSRGNRREPIYWDRKDYGRFERFLIEVTMKSKVQLYAWCLMPNHFHLLVETPDENLTDFMHRLLTRYALYFNRVHNQVGHLFQGRYKAIVCEREPYLMALVRYIHLNPFKGMQGESVNAIQWRWSSHRFYMAEEVPQVIRQPIQRVLGLFGQQMVTAREEYAKFLSSGLQHGTWEDFYQVKGNRYLGSETFIERAKTHNAEPVRERPRRLKTIIRIEDLGKTAEKALGVTGEHMRSPSQERKLGRARQAFVYVARRCYRIPTVALARYLGRRESTISEMMRRCEDRTEPLPDVEHLLMALTQDHS